MTLIFVYTNCAEIFQAHCKLRHKDDDDNCDDRPNDDDHGDWCSKRYSNRKSAFSTPAFSTPAIYSCIFSAPICICVRGTVLLLYTVLLMLFEASLWLLTFHL